MTDKVKTKNNSDRLLRIREVLEIVPVGRSTWWAGIKAGRFPKPVKLGSRTTCWKQSDIMNLVERGI